MIGLFGGSAQRMLLKDFNMKAKGTQWATTVGAGTGWTYIPSAQLPNELWCNPSHPQGAHY